MKLWDRFISRLRLAKLYKELKKRKFSKKFHNLQSAKHIGIIFDSSQKKIYQYLDDLNEFLKNKNIKITTFSYSKSSEQPPIADYFITSKDIKWCGVPKIEKISDFINQNYDILILLAEQENFILQYVFALTYAQLKVSPHYKELNFADLMFSLKEHHDLETFIESIKTYLLEIKTQ